MAEDEDDDFTANAGRRAPPREAANRVEPIRGRQVAVTQPE